MTLNNVTGTNIYCGPAIISATTGITTDQAEKMIQELRRNNTPVKGVYTTELEAVYHKLGFTLAPPSFKPGTLFNTLCSLDPGVWAIVVPGHYVCVEVTTEKKRFYIDSFTRKPMSAAASARGMQKVVWIRRITKLQSSTK